MRRILSLAVPSIGANVARMLMGFIDFTMVSWLGTDAQAAISPATIMVFAVLCIGNGIAAAVTTFAAQSLGRGERHEAGAFGWQTFYLAVAFGVVMWPTTWLVPDFFRWVGHAPGVMAAEVDYTRIALWCVAPSIIVSGLDGFFTGVQRPAISLVGVVVALVTNAVLNYGLIFGRWGMPEMGVAGAALATLIGWWVRAAILMVAFWSKEYGRAFGTRRRVGPSLRRLRGLLYVGGPSALQWLLDIAAWAVFMTFMMARYGTPAMAATNIAIQYMHLAFMPAVGIGMALTSLVGHAIGEGRPDRAARRTRAAVIMTSAYMGSIGLMFALAPAALMRVFSGDPDVIAAGCIVLLWAAAFQAFDGLSIVYSGALRGAGDTRWPALAFIGYAWGVFLGGGWLVARLAPGLGLNGPWMMCTLYIMLLGLTMWWRFARGAWRRIRLETSAPVAA